MLHIVLFQPEIPPNTGNIMRLAANTGCRLHLIEPLGFRIDEKRLRRAGLDYRDRAGTRVHPSYADFINSTEFNNLYAFTTKARRLYTAPSFSADDVLLFGPETRGLPAEILDSLSSDNKLRIPMADASRSLNLSNSVAIAAYEAWRQLGFNQGTE